MIRVVHLGSRIRMLTFYPSRMQGSKKRWIPIRIRNTASNLRIAVCRGRRSPLPGGADPRGRGQSGRQAPDECHRYVRVRTEMEFLNTNF
jgi:hypothetical protein